MTYTKGIILLEGSNTRPDPITKAISKQLLPMYDKSMIYYPLLMLMLAEIREMPIISTLIDTSCFKYILRDGSEYGIALEYITQENPKKLLAIAGHLSRMNMENIYKV